jgi:Flp pilus assembly protein TadG
MSSNKRLPFTSARGSNAGESGQALIETAITLSLLLIMLIGATEIGRIAWASVQVTEAARAAVQYGDLNRKAASDTVGIQNAGSAAAPGLSNLTITPTTSCICGDGSASTCATTDCSGSFLEGVLTVKTSTTFDPLIHLPGLPRTYTLQAQAVQKILSND